MTQRAPLISSDASVLSYLFLQELNCVQELTTMLIEMAQNAVFLLLNGVILHVQACLKLVQDKVVKIVR